MKTLYLAKEPDLGVRNDLSHISGEITIVDCLNGYLDWYRKKGYNCISKDEFFENDDMRFDTIIGNPPFQESTHNAKNSSLWKKFLEKSFTISDTVSLIVPASFTSPATRFESIKPYLKFVSFNIKQYFPGVGVQFCRFILDRNHTGPCTIESHEGDIFTLDLTNECGIPETITPQLIEDAKSIFRNNLEWHKTCEYHTQQKKKFDEDGKVSVMHGAQTLRSNTEHPNNSKIRVQCPTTKHPIFTVIKDMGLSQTHMWTEVESIEEGEKLCEWLNSDKVQGILRHFKWANMYYPQTIKKLG